MRTMPRGPWGRERLRLRTSLEDRGPPETVRHAGGSEASLSLSQEVGKTRVESLDVTLVV